MKSALITGITGQDGSYLSEFLLEKGYEVHGIVRRSSVERKERIAHLEGNPHFHIHYGDMTDSISLIKIVARVKPDEIYNLAAQSHVKVSFEVPEYTADADAIGTLRLLEALRTAGLEKTCKFYQASTSELFGKVQEIPQKETTPFYPYSPYAAGKLDKLYLGNLDALRDWGYAKDYVECMWLILQHETPEDFVFTTGAGTASVK